jgi:hypothetical protein
MAVTYTARGTIARSTSEALQSSIAGDVFVPGDSGYDEARRAFALTVDQRPSVVVLAESAADVVRAVRFARSQGMRIAPQSTGHGVVPLEPLEGAMLVKAKFVMLAGGLAPTPDRRDAAHPVRPAG